MRGQLASARPASVGTAPVTVHRRLAGQPV